MEGGCEGEALEAYAMQLWVVNRALLAEAAEAA
jgi:hypothetical protein